MRSKRRWGAVVAYTIGIFAASSIPGHRMPVGGHVWDFDKLIHGAVFAGLGALLYWALQGPAARRLLGAVVLTAGYGALDELHQRFTPGRSSDPWDLAADVVGACAGALLVLVVGHLIRSQDANPS